MKIEVVGTNGVIEYVEASALTPINVIAAVHRRLDGSLITADTMKMVFHYLDYALSTGDIKLAKQVHLVLFKIFLPEFLN